MHLHLITILLSLKSSLQSCCTYSSQQVHHHSPSPVGEPLQWLLWKRSGDQSCGQSHSNWKLVATCQQVEEDLQWHFHSSCLLDVLPSLQRLVYVCVLQKEVELSTAAIKLLLSACVQKICILKLDFNQIWDVELSDRCSYHVAFSASLLLIWLHWL